MRIDVTRYAEDKECATPEGLKARLLRELTPVIEGIELQRNRCLVATYIRPNITRGGIIITDKQSEEDRWQGKVGLLLKVGPTAFDYEELHQRADAILADADETGVDVITVDDAQGRAAAELNLPRVGDWVAYRTSETHEVGVEVAPGVCASCRQIYDESIVMVVSDPSKIW
jgi:hypothetical protein